jgi:hypothetical protein
MVTFSRNPRGKESIEVFFPGQSALLRFVRNMKNDFFELDNSITIIKNSFDYTYDTEKGIPTLVIYDETNNDTRIRPPKPPKPPYNEPPDPPPYEPPDLPPHEPPDLPPHGGRSRSASHRPAISGETPVMAANRQSNYLEPSAVVEYLEKYHGISRGKIVEIVGQYRDEAELLGINHDIAIAQMCHATEFLTNNLWRTNNYANLNKNGAIWNGKNWNGEFSSIRAGVKAHIMHLRGYGSIVPGRLEGEMVDPRFHKLATLRGKGDTLHNLCRFWTGNDPRKYEDRLKTILKELYDFQDCYNQLGLAALR